MPYPGVHALNTVDLFAYSPSVGATPVKAYARANMFGTVKKFTCVLGGTLTGDATVTVANVTQGTTIGTFTLTAAGSVGGSLFSGTPASYAVSQINEDDIVSFTSASGTGATIPGNFTVIVRNN